MDTNRIENEKQMNFSKQDFEKLSVSEKTDLFVQGYRVPKKQDNSESLNNIRQRIAQQEKFTIKPNRKFRLYWPVAASIAVLALLSALYFYLSPGKMNVFTVEKGQHREFLLPDGSEVKMNADSKITYSASGFNSRREVELAGEAFFTVKKGIPFVVKTPVGTVEVLGTTLNVFSRANELNVACFSGKVKISVNNQSVVILPGEKVSYINGVLEKSIFPVKEKEAEWTFGKFSFDNIPLTSIFEEIERQFNVDISATGIESRYFTGSFSNTKLTEALETVCLTMNLEYEIRNGNHIYIKPKEK